MKLKDKLIRFMYGRYGGRDALNKTLMWSYFILIFLGVLTGLDILVWLALVLCVWYTFRAFSRNIWKRQKENLTFIDLKNKAKLPFKRLFDRKHAYRTCPYCKATLRLPRKKGEHTVGCPKCRKDFKVKI